MARKQFIEAVVLLALFLAALSPVLAMLMWPASDVDFRVRLSGMLLQWAGLGTVIWGLNKRPTAYGMPTWTRAISGAVRRGVVRTYNQLPWRRRTVSAVGHAQGVSAAVGVGEVVVIAQKISGLDSRVAHLEAEMKRIDGALSATDQKVTKLGTETNERFERERSDREKKLAEIKDMAKKASGLGDVAVELAGIGFLFVGIVFTSVPTEIACLIR